MGVVRAASRSGRSTRPGSRKAGSASRSSRANGSAKSVEDYDARSGAIVFNAGETSKTIAVTVKGDRKVEGNEVFYLNLSGAAGAFLADSQGAGVIRNDDR
jgi:hypothetical protein